MHYQRVFPMHLKLFCVDNNTVYIAIAQGNQETYWLRTLNVI